VTRRRVLTAAGWIALFFVTGPLSAFRSEAADATTSITVRAGKSDSANYLLARQFAEALVLAGNGKFALDVKESQGSVRNVIDAPKDSANTIFTASRSVIQLARHGAKPFAPNPGYADIRSLFPIPFQTLHWVVRPDSNITSIEALAGHGFVPGSKGSVSERVTGSALQFLGLERKVQLMDLDVAAAPGAVMSNKVSGLAVAGSYPIPVVTDIAKATPIRLLGLDKATIDKMVAADDSIAPQIIPKGTYAGVDQDIATVAVSAGAYTTRRMSNETAYAITKAFWTQIGALVNRNAAWSAITASALPTLGIKLHPGALRYYEEANMAVPETIR
jgi:TRAP transporter TAXI family solute receptor